MRYVALLRGINVGGRTIKMDALRACFDEMKFDDVATVLQTGNVLFSSDNHPGSIKEEIATGLQRMFEYPARVLVYDLARLQRIAAATPFGVRDPAMQSYVVFFDNGLEKQLMAEATDLDDQLERIQVGDGVLYWRVPKGRTLQSGFASYLTKARYKNFHTNRNINTIRKIIG